MKMLQREGSRDHGTTRRRDQGRVAGLWSCGPVVPWSCPSAWSFVPRGLALFLGGFALLNLAGDLRSAFLFLTRLRQHLRLRSTGSPTDLLPEEPAEQEILARSLGLSTAADLQERYRTITTRVRELFTQLFLNS